MQDTHDEVKADYSNKSVGMKLETAIQLQDDSGIVEYQLMLIIFREGRHNNGHYYVAARTPTATWKMFNNHQAMMPMQLRDLQKNYGKRVHGVVYRRKSDPAEDDWACLNPTGRLASRQVPLPRAPSAPHPPLGPTCSPLPIGADSDQADQLCAYACMGTSRGMAANLKHSTSRVRSHPVPLTLPFQHYWCNTARSVKRVPCCCMTAHCSAALHVCNTLHPSSAGAAELTACT